MNKIYSIFWNASLGRYTIASEHAKPKACMLKKVASAMGMTVFVSMLGILNLVNASVSISDGGVIFAGHNESSAGSNLAPKVAGAFASHDAIAIVGDGDCAPLAAGTLTDSGLYGTGENHKNGIYGLGEQTTSVNNYYGYNAGTGMNAVSAWNSTGIFGIDTASARAGSSATQAFGLNSAAIGCSAKAYGMGSYALGMATLATGTGSTALGLQSQATGHGSVAAGVGSVASGEDSIAMSALSTASGVASMALGKKSQAVAESAIAIGDSASASFTASIALGRNAISAGFSALAMGDGAQANANNSIALGADSIATRANTISVGDVGAERQITNVAKGTHDTDAVTIAQLKSSVALLGNDAMIKDDGSISSPNYRVQGGKQFTVGDALDALNIGVNKNTLAISENKTIAENANIATNAKVTANTDLINTNKGLTDVSISKINQTINSIVDNVNGGSIGLVQQSDITSDIKVASNSLGAKVDFKDSASKSRVLTGVSNGIFGSDAVNFSQLSDTNVAVETNKTTADNTNIATNLKVMANTDLINTNKGLTDVSISKINQTINSIVDNVNGGSIGLVQQSDITSDIKVASNSLGAKVDFKDSASKSRVLTGVSNGIFGSDAVNFSQLSDTNVAVETNKTTADNANIATNAKVTANTDLINTNKGLTDAAISKNTLAIGENKTAISENKALTDQKIADNKSSSDIAIQSNTSLINNNKLETDATIFANKVIAENTNIATNAKVTANTDLINTNKGLTDISINKLNQTINSIVDNVNGGSIGLVQQSDITSDIKVASNSLGAKVDFKDSASKSRVLTGVSNGISGSDAVNFSQLSDTNVAVIANTASINKNSEAIDKNINNLASVIANVGGASAIDAAGNFVAPTYVVGKNIVTGAMGKAHTSIAGALTDIDTTVMATVNNLNSLQTEIINISNTVNSGNLGLISLDLPNNRIILAGGLAGNSVDFSGTSGSRILTGVSAGKAHTDAVNVGQLHDLYSSLGGTVNLDGTINAPTFTIQNTELNLKESISLLDTIISQIDTKIMSSVHYDVGNSNTLTLGRGIGRSLMPVSIKNLANGVVASGSLDAVNGGQLFEVSQRIHDSVEGLVQVDKGDANRVNVAAGQSGTVIDVAGASGDRIISGVKAGIADNDAATIGQIKDLILTVNNVDSQMIAVNNVAKYANAKAEGDNALSIGSGSVALANNTTSMGTLSIASGDSAMAMGVKALASGQKSIAIGAESRAVGESSIVLGQGGQALARNSVALGAGSIADRENTISVGAMGAERQIVNVAAGTAGTDAVNVNQLNAGLSNVYSQNEARIQTLDKKISKLDKRVNGGIASAMAIAGIVQNPTPGGSSVGGAIYGFGNQMAVAIGVSSVSKNGHWSVKAAGTITTDGKLGGGAGVSYNW